MEWRQILEFFFNFAFMFWFSYKSSYMFMFHYLAKTLIKNWRLKCETKNTKDELLKKIIFIILYLFNVPEPCTCEGDFGQSVWSHLGISSNLTFCWLWFVPHYVLQCTLFPTFGTFSDNSSKQTQGAMLGIL